MKNNQWAKAGAKSADIGGHQQMHDLTPRSPHRREIDFTGETMVLHEVEKLAKQEMRSFKGQVLFMLREALERLW